MRDFARRIDRALAIDPDAVMGVFPADHVIGKAREYARLLRPAFRTAAHGEMVVLGIEPRWAETGYGYIEFPSDVHAGTRGPARVLSFREKPDASTAAGFIAAGNAPNRCCDFSATAP